MKWDYLFIVLFNIEVSFDKTKNDELYKAKKQEIINNISYEKKERVFFIEINTN
jgi:hypothetical protein